MRDRPADTAEYIWTLIKEGRRIASLPDSLRPATRAGGYAAQAHLERHSARPLFGWKIAATSRAGQEHIQVDAPLAGRLLAERVFTGGAEVSLDNNQMRVVEAEFAFRMAYDLPPREQPYTRQEALAAIATLHPAIEVPNSRFEPFEKAGAPQLIADNACADYCLVGEAAPDAWRAIDLAAHQVTVVDGAGAVHTGTGANVLGDPLIALTWIANELSSIGVTLKAGQVVITGTCIKPVAVKPGDHVRLDFGTIGKIDVNFAK